MILKRLMSCVPNPSPRLFLRVAERMAGYAASGVTTLALAPYGADLAVKLATLTAATEAYELAGVA